MEFLIKTGPVERQRGGAVVAAVFARQRLSPAAEALDHATGGWLKGIVRREQLGDRRGQVLTVHQPPGIPAERIVLVAAGRASDLDGLGLRTIADAAAQELTRLRVRDAVSTLAGLEASGTDCYRRVRHVVEATAARRYRFDRFRTSNDDAAPVLRRLTVLCDADHREVATLAAAHARAVAAGSELARTLADTPANHCTPSELARQARELAAAHPRLKATVLDEARMRRLGMGALLAVAQGSEEPARLIVLEYRGGASGEAPVALVGKGVTFDSGGISIKPAANMDEMKYDMSGAASVLGTLRAVAELELPLNVVGVIPATENLPSGKAVKPGDIVTSLAGTTIEILNTDAEGRLILCDALTYARRYKPDTVIDIATLTGACVIALGKHATGLFANDDSLAGELTAAGQASADRCWHMPLWEEYQEQLKSPFADVANVGGREAGAVTAACFLARFTEGLRWAHLDIAGTAWLTGKEKGATGRPVPLLSEYLLRRARAVPGASREP